MCWFFLLHLHPLFFLPPSHPSLLSIVTCCLFLLCALCLLPLSFLPVSLLPSLSVLVLSTLATYSPRKHPLHFHSSGIQPDVYAIFSPHARVPQPRCAFTSDTSHAPAQALCFSICHVTRVGLPSCVTTLCHCPQATAGRYASCTHTYIPSSQSPCVVVL